MSVLGREIRAMQNPAIGATLIASAIRGFSEASGVNAGMPLPLTFLVLPITLHAATYEMVAHTLKKSGLRYLSDKFGQAKHSQSDLVLAIQARALSFRAITFESLNIMLHSEIAILEPKKGEVWASEKLEHVLDMIQSEKELHKNSEKLGYWFGMLTPFELSSILKVAF
jgi:hypothetical protein